MGVFELASWGAQCATTGARKKESACEYQREDRTSNRDGSRRRSCEGRLHSRFRMGRWRVRSSSRSELGLGGRVRRRQLYDSLRSSGRSGERQQPRRFRRVREVDALPPNILSQLIRAAFTKHVNKAKMNAVKEREKLDKQRLREAVEEIQNDDV